MPTPITITNLRGGRNGVDSPVAPDFPERQVTEALNVDFAFWACGERRGGGSAIGITGGTAFSGGIKTTIRHVPAGDEGLAELWGVDGTGLVKRLVGGTTMTNVTLDDAITAGYEGQVEGVSFNGKLYLFYNSAVDRLHVWDPSLASPRVRRVGILGGQGPPTIANTGAGAYAATARFYRVRFLQLDGTRIVRRSEASQTSTVFAPSGAGTAARITRPTAPGEGETHWEVEVSLNGATWNVIAGSGSNVPNAAIAIATTTFDDDDVTTTYTSNRASDLTGMYALFPSMKFGITDTNRLIGTGAWESATPYQSRVWFSPVLGSDDSGDDERWVNQLTLKTRADISEGDGGAITGIIGTVNGIFWVCKYRQTWRFTPTTNLAVPYVYRKISHSIGSLGQRSMIMAEDAAGAPAAYWLSHRGPYSASVNGLEYMGRDVEDIWRALKHWETIGGINLAATVPAHGVFYDAKFQLYFWIAVSGATTPNIRLRCDVKEAVRRDQYGVRGGWVVDAGLSCEATCSVMWANTIAAAMSKDLKPHAGLTATTVILKCDTADLTDGGGVFEAYWVTKSLLPVAAINRNAGVHKSVVVARAKSGEVLQQTLIADFYKRTQTTNVHLDPALFNPSMIRVLRVFDGSEMVGVGVVFVKIGDGEIVSRWAVEALVLDVEDEGDQEFRSS